MTPIWPKQNTQEYKVLKVLLDANGEWVDKQHFVRVMWLTQAGRAIWNLENKYHWQIEHSPFTDTFGFRSYRIKTESRQEHLFETRLSALEMMR